MYVSSLRLKKEEDHLESVVNHQRHIQPNNLQMMKTGMVMKPIAHIILQVNTLMQSQPVSIRYCNFIGFFAA